MKIKYVAILDETRKTVIITSFTSYLNVDDKKYLKSKGLIDDNTKYMITEEIKMNINIL